MMPGMVVRNRSRAPFEIPLRPGVDYGYEHATPFEMPQEAQLPGGVSGVRILEKSVPGSVRWAPGETREVPRAVADLPQFRAAVASGVLAVVDNTLRRPPLENAEMTTLASSKIVLEEEAPSLHQISATPTAVAGFVGVTEKGGFEPALCQSFGEYTRKYGGDVASGDVCAAARGFFENGGTQLWVQRVVHLTDVTDPTSKTSAAATLALLTAAASATAGYSQAATAGPYALASGDTLSVKIDGGGAATATFTATAAARESGAETFNLTDGWTLTVSIDGGSVQTVTFHTANFVSIAAATAEEVAAVINGVLLGASASVTSGGTKVTITSDKKGTGSGVNVTGGTANGALGFTTGNVAGTGNVVDILAVTATEVATIGQAAVSGSTWTVVSGAPRITSNTTGGSSSVWVQSGSTADDEIGFDNASHVGLAGTAVLTLTVDGLYDGTYANALTVKIAAATSGEATRFNLQVIKSGVILESFVNLSMDPDDTRYVETIVNDASNGSAYVVVTDELAAVPSPGNKPATGTFGPLTGGGDGLAGLVDTDFIGGSGTNGKTGMRALDMVGDLRILAIPGKATSAVHNAMLAYTEVTRQGSVFAVLDPPALSAAAAIAEYVTTTAALKNLSEFGGIYWPRVKVLNPDTSVFGKTVDGLVTVPPSGHVAGVYARTDNAREGGVYDPPAGIDKGVLFGVLGFETNECLDEEKRDLVYPARVNPLTTGVGLPRYIDGNRTLKETGNFPTVAERRGVIFIEQSIKAGLEFARHKNNDETLRARVKRAVDNFLTAQMNVGAFRSKDPAKAFFSDFGDGLNIPAVVFAGKLIGRIGLATQKPVDWVILRFSQDTRAFDNAALPRRARIDS